MSGLASPVFFAGGPVGPCQRAEGGYCVDDMQGLLLVVLMMRHAPCLE